MQRVLFARLLLQDSRLVVLDEPFNAIDEKTVADLTNLIRRWHREGRTVLAALHDFDLVRQHFPQTLLLAREPVAWGETGRVLTPEHLMKARRMCGAFDEEPSAVSQPSDDRSGVSSPAGNDRADVTERVPGLALRRV
jgi:zinc/manganese transport system ATP-binding protein